jgi:hypothetical protein
LAALIDVAANAGGRQQTQGRKMSHVVFMITELQKELARRLEQR